MVAHRLLPWLTVVWFLVPVPASANSATVIGLGTGSCGQWTQDRKARSFEAVSRESWVTGFLSAYNVAGLAKSGNITSGLDSEGLFSWIDNYCASHPLDQLVKATVELINTLKQQGR